MPRRQVSTTANGPTDQTAREISQILINWGRRNYQEFPWRENHGWQALIAEVMLQRTRAKNVVPVYERLVREYPEPRDLANASLAEVEELIYSLGLRWRAPLVKELASLIAKQGIPDSYDELCALPGVGDYVASAWLSLHADKRAVLVDANIVRFICRLHGVSWDGETRRQPWVREMASRLTPYRAHKDYNYAALDFTMSICKTKPQCDECPLGGRHCAYASNVKATQ